MTDQGSNAIALRPETDLAETMSLGSVLSKSGYFQDARDAAQAVVKVLAGRELGFGPIASMTGIYLVKGRVTISAALMAAAIKRSGRYDYRLTEHTDKVCAIDFYQRSKDGWDKVGPSRFTWDDATRAGLGGGENYKHFPRNMLFARAMSNGAKWYCADVFGGPIYTPEELGLRVDGETGEPANVEALAPATPRPAVVKEAKANGDGPSFEPFGAVTMAAAVAKSEGGDSTMSVVLERYFGPGIRTKGRLETLAQELPDFYREKYLALHREYDAVKAGL